MAHDLKFFMREQKAEIIKAKGPETFKDDKGEVIEFEIKKLTRAEIQHIFNGYKTRTILKDKRGTPLVVGNEAIFETVKNNEKAQDRIIVEALQYPNLKDKELMKFYGCVDITEMPGKVFPSYDEYSHVLKIVTAALGIGDFGEDEDDSDLVDEAKN